MNRKSRILSVGKCTLGGGNPVRIQSMCDTDTRNIAQSSAQIKELAEAGCEIIRLAAPDIRSAEVLKEIVAESPIPVIADVHFDGRIALQSLDSGVHGLRINPGNLQNPEMVKAIALKAAEKNAVIRVGANSGSVDVDLLNECRKKFPDEKTAMTEALIQSVTAQCSLLEKYGFNNIKVSLKSSSVLITLDAYKEFAKRYDYPLHIGITEAGTLRRGMIKSAVGIGHLLLSGIGDTLRVSLTAPPVEEVRTAVAILESCGLRKANPEIVSCPTCGRTEIDLKYLAGEVENFIDSLKTANGSLPYNKVAVMGCIVNGPGEARDADWGIAGGKGKIAIFRKGELYGTYPEKEGLAVFKEILKQNLK